MQEDSPTILREIATAIEAERAKVASIVSILERLAGYAATARNENTHEWMTGLTDLLNESASILDEPKVFVWHRRQLDGEEWITCKDIP